MLMSPFLGEKTEASCLLSDSGPKLSSGPLPRTVPPNTRGSACSSRCSAHQYLTGMETRFDLNGNKSTLHKTFCRRCAPLILGGHRPHCHTTGV